MVIFKRLLRNTYFLGVLLSVGSFVTATEDNENATTKVHELAEWSILTYTQADNNLWSFSNLDIGEMEKAGSTDKVNILVQLDKPTDNKTWRYRVEKGKRVEDASINQEMGISPAKEIVDAMRWVKEKYPAKRYAIILWNHGNGVLDRSLSPLSLLGGWLRTPGFRNILQERGILYDDSQNTYVGTNQLSSIFSQVKEILGQPVDLVGMDACLMAMIEVAYEIKDSARYLVASQELEPGDGWPYDLFLTPLVANPELYSSSLLASTIVSTYKESYRTDPECTQSAIRLDRIATLKYRLDRVVSGINYYVRKYRLGRSEIKKAVDNARKKSVSFYISEYKDLHSFCSELEKEITALKAKKTSRLAQSRLNTIASRLRSVMSQVDYAVIANDTGSAYKEAHGLSIYVPNGYVQSDYKQTSFAKDSSWVKFLEKYS